VGIAATIYNVASTILSKSTLIYATMSFTHTTASGLMALSDSCGGRIMAILNISDPLYRITHHISFMKVDFGKKHPLNKAKSTRREADGNKMEWNWK